MARGVLLFKQIKLIRLTRIRIIMLLPNIRGISMIFIISSQYMILFFTIYIRAYWDVYVCVSIG